jgi:hypothetical protein
MGGSKHAVQTKQASQLLRDFLESRRDYRRQWQEHSERRRSDRVSLAGTSRVIALYLWRSGERADSETTLARDLKDRVRRALTGQGITPQTLTWFIEAFGMDPRDEQSLWAAFAGDMDPNAGISYTLSIDRELAFRQRHRTIALFERYTIAADRSFVTRRTLQTIMALDDGVNIYPFNHEPSVDRIAVVYGGMLGERYVHGGGLHTNAIVLDRELRAGQTASLEYVACYPSGRYTATEVRRPAHGRSENIDIAVQFDAAAVPRQVAWSVWTDHRDGQPVESEPVALDGQRSARRFVRYIEETAVGFNWAW